MQLGIDLVQISELKKRLDDESLLAKVFTTSELQQNSRVESLAGIYAAKEAFFKALGKKLNWLDVWIEKIETGMPTIHSAHLNNLNATVSISHSGDYATAVVVIESI